MRTYSDECPCVRSEKSPTEFQGAVYFLRNDVGYIERADPDCNLCGASGWTEFVEFDNPRNVTIVYQGE